MRRASSSQSEAPLEGAMGEIVTLIIQVRAALLGIAQGCPQSCDPPGRYGFERFSAHLVSPLDCVSPTMRGQELSYPRFLLNCCRTLAAIAVADQ